MVVESCTVTNDGWRFEPMDADAPARAVAIRGYGVGERGSGLEIEISQPGDYVLSGLGALRRESDAP